MEQAWVKDKMGTKILLIHSKDLMQQEKFDIKKHSYTILNMTQILAQFDQDISHHCKRKYVIYDIGKWKMAKIHYHMAQAYHGDNVGTSKSHKAT